MPALPRLQRLVKEITTAAYVPRFGMGGLPHAQSSMPDVRRIARSSFFKNQPPFLRFFIQVVLIITWPIRVLYLAQKYTRLFGAQVEQRTGKSVLRQGREQIKLALVHALDPKMYYQYQFYRKSQRARVNEYAYNKEMQALFAYLNQYQSESIQNKVQFSTICGQRGLPTVPVLASIKPGQLPVQLPATDLFIKTARGAKGEGAMRWQYRGDGAYAHHLGQVLTSQALKAKLAQHARQGVLIIQPVLHNHPDLADLSGDTLSTIRLVTGRYPDGRVVCLAATYKIPRGEGITDTHGLSAPIDLQTGILGAAVSYHPLSPKFDTHPRTDAIITKRKLPDWTSVRKLAVKAHQVFSDYVFLGWDIALTPEGPLLLEGNVGWDVLTVQKPQDTPLGQTEFVEVCIAHLTDR